MARTVQGGEYILGRGQGPQERRGGKSERGEQAAASGSSSLLGSLLLLPWKISLLYFNFIIIFRLLFLFFVFVFWPLRFSIFPINYLFFTSLSNLVKGQQFWILSLTPSHKAQSYLGPIMQWVLVIESRKKVTVHPLWEGYNASAMKGA